MNDPPQEAMLLTLSETCLQRKQTRRETDVIGHRSPFGEQFRTEWTFTIEDECQWVLLSVS